MRLANVKSVREYRGSTVMTNEQRATMERRPALEMQLENLNDFIQDINSKIISARSWLYVDVIIETKLMLQKEKELTFLHLEMGPYSYPDTISLDFRNHGVDDPRTIMKQIQELPPELTPTETERNTDMFVDCEILTNASEGIRGDADIMMAAVSKSGYFLRFANLELLSNVAIVGKAMETDNRLIDLAVGAAREPLLTFSVKALKKTWRSFETMTEGVVNVVPGALTMLMLGHSDVYYEDKYYGPARLYECNYLEVAALVTKLLQPPYRSLPEEEVEDWAAAILRFYKNGQSFVSMGAADLVEIFFINKRGYWHSEVGPLEEEERAWSTAFYLTDCAARLNRFPPNFHSARQVPGNQSMVLNLSRDFIITWKAVEIIGPPFSVSVWQYKFTPEYPLQFSPNYIWDEKVHRADTEEDLNFMIQSLKHSLRFAYSTEGPDKTLMHELHSADDVYSIHDSLFDDLSDMTSSSDEE